MSTVKEKPDVHAATLIDPDAFVPLDFLPDPPGVRLLRREGVVYGALFSPTRAGARPESR